MKDHLHIYGLGFLLIVAGFVLAYQFVEPAPPKTITIATGAKTGAYFAYAKRYKSILAREGITLNIVNTEGSVDNLMQLQKGDVDIAFVQSGTGLPYLQQEGSSAVFTSLASVYFEPLWGFSLASNPVTSVSNLLDKKIALGSKRSGSFAIADIILSSNSINVSGSAFSHLPNNIAAQKLLSGDLDFMFLVASVEAPLVQELLETQQVVTFDFSRAEAYTRRYRFLSAVTLPQGVISLGKNIPAKDISLLAAAATLVTTEDLHPALVSLLMQAIEEVHGAGGIFEDPGQFPSRYYVDFPLDTHALRYFEHGPPLLQRYLPFWLAVLADQLKVFLIPIIALMIPLVRILPPMYRWRIRSRIYRWYRDLREIEMALSDPDLNEHKRQHLLARFEAVYDDVKRESVPLSYNDELYHLRMHMRMVRDSLTQHESPPETIPREGVS